MGATSPAVALYLLAFVDAILCESAVLLCVLAVRRNSPGLAMLGTLAAATTGPVFYAMSKLDRGSLVGPATAGAVATLICSTAIAVRFGEEQSRGKWIGAGLVVVGVLVRSLSK